MYQNRIYGLKGAAMKMAAQNKSESPGGKDTESHPGPAHGRDTVVEEAGSSTWSPSPSMGQTLGRRDKGGGVARQGRTTAERGQEG